MQRHEKSGSVLDPEYCKTGSYTTGTRDPVQNLAQFTSTPESISVQVKHPNFFVQVDFTCVKTSDLVFTVQSGFTSFQTHIC